jgi:hypothetical protein
LRWTQAAGADRGFVLGGVGSGKSTLCDELGADFVARYRAAGARRLILDSKPRYRAELTAQGTSAARRYRRWGHGAPIPGSVVVDDPADMRIAWETGARTVIVQCDDPAELPRLTAATASFFRQANAKRPQLLQVDELMDFYHSNGSPIGGNNAIVRCARAGRELGIAVLAGSQRTYNIPSIFLQEMTRLYAFLVDATKDVKRLSEMGAPPFPIPTKPHAFRYWYKGDRGTVYGPYRLELAR